ncbi:NAD(P)-dependent oxidoreductase [Salinisphaera sp. USBA-960]|uniref:NAD(P)-dependent oxidoreductase n=1 Tax=Salinisphaera orenii TaxID=856731 RepID=UPI000DBE707F|nr:NAD(P)-dependent oxidoreductase [Salifodinibacter halophilus]NNC25415.1 NAD(P)-dependent oxidoreductase [Salifodinibacter halophilus]
MSYSITILGAGVMGNAIGTRLLEMGQTLTVYDLDTAKAEFLGEKGARVAKSGGAAAAEADVVILSLNNATVVEASVFGDDGIAAGARKGALIIDMSSIDPNATKALAGRAKESGLRWVDSPLSGGAPKAATGELTLMLGGEDADIADARAVLQHVATSTEHLGPVGAGQATKLINQVLCGVGFLAVAEATQLAVDAGLDPHKVPGALKGGRADSAILQEYMPRFADKDYRREGRIDNMVKDLNGVQELARATNTAMPLTSLCADIHRMLTTAGLGEEDQAVLMEFFKGPDKERFGYKFVASSHRIPRREGDSPTTFKNLFA